MLKKSDIVISIIIGFLIGALFLIIFKNVGAEIPYRWLLPIVFPFLTFLGIFLAAFIGRKLLIVWQAAKFLLVGALNTCIDLGVLNLLILISGIAFGSLYSVFKGISFTVALINSYFWNKLWTFKKPKTTAPGKEFLQFFIISVIGFSINVGAASLVVNVIGPQFGLTPEVWANIGAIAASLCGMAWNFLGYKFVVFKG